MALPQNFDKRIELQRRTIVKDAAGGSSEQWMKYKGAWAAVMNLSGEERSLTDHGGRAAVARTVFTIWYDREVNEAMRIAYGGRYFNIRHVNNYNEQNHRLILTCDTGAAQ